MVFSSIIFLFFFLPVVLVLYYTVCAPSVAMRNGLLLLTSLFFYAWGEPKNVLLLIGSCVLNWGIALAISRWRRYGKLLLVLDCAANLGVLFVFKYLGFAVTNLKAVLGDSFLPQVDIALPIGISFFTFQALSYVIDVYRCLLYTSIGDVELFLFDEQGFQKDRQNHIGKNDRIHNIAPALGSELSGGDFQSVVIQKIGRQPD